MGKPKEAVMKYKFIFWKEAKEFKTQKETQDEFTYYICWVTGESDAGTEQREVNRLEEEFSQDLPLFNCPLKYISE